MTMMTGIMFMSKMIILALIVATVNTVIYDGFGGEAWTHLQPGGDDQFNAMGTIGTLYLLGWYMVAIIVLSGVIGMVVQVFKPDSRDMAVPTRGRRR